MGSIIEALMDKPAFFLIVGAILLAKAALVGVDIRPFVAKAVDEAIPALA